MMSGFHQIALVCFYEAAVRADRLRQPVGECVQLAGPMLELTREAVVRGGKQCSAGELRRDQATVATHAAALELAERTVVELNAPHAMRSAAVDYLRRAWETGDDQREIAVLF